MIRQTCFSALVALTLAGCSETAETPEDSAVATPVGMATSKVAEPAYDGPIPMPIMVGSEGSSLAACGALAEVVSLSADGLEYLSVRDAPSDTVKERDRLNLGERVYICDTSGAWRGVVYSNSGDTAGECGLGRPVAGQQAYRGSCAQGWVRSRYLNIIAE